MRVSSPRAKRCNCPGEPATAPTGIGPSGRTPGNLAKNLWLCCAFGDSRKWAPNSSPNLVRKGRQGVALRVAIPPTRRPFRRPLPAEGARLGAAPGRAGSGDPGRFSRARARGRGRSLGLRRGDLRHRTLLRCGRNVGAGSGANLPEGLSGSRRCVPTRPPAPRRVGSVASSPARPRCDIRRTGLLRR